MVFHLPMSVNNGSSHKIATLKPEKEAARRTGNYKPSICDNDFIQSLSSDYGEARFRKRAEVLKEYVRNNLLVDRSKNEGASGSCIELIDTLQRLGLGYLFEDEIRTVLVNIQKFRKEKQNNLYHASLMFRILRQHGFFIPEDEFTPFMENGGFKEALGNDTRAMLSLYDASYLSMEGETLLDDAREFASRHLKQALTEGNLNFELSKLVEKGSEFPYYWRLPRIEARWWIDLYERNEKKNVELLELAKLDYNICQASHQTDIKTISRWWMDKSLAKLLPFSRERIPESFLFGLGHVSDPKYSHATQWITLAYQFLSTVDDMYDIYGTLEELELFTSAVERWDVNALDELPIYMRPCYLALLNFNHEVGYTTLKLQGQNIIPTMKKIEIIDLKPSWFDLCDFLFN